MMTSYYVIRQTYCQNVEGFSFISFFMFLSKNKDSIPLRLPSLFHLPGGEPPSWPVLPLVLPQWSFGKGVGQVPPFILPRPSRHNDRQTLPSLVPCTGAVTIVGGSLELPMWLTDGFLVTFFERWWGAVRIHVSHVQLPYMVHCTRWTHVWWWGAIYAYMCTYSYRTWCTVHSELTCGGGGNIRIHVYLQLPYMVHHTRCTVHGELTCGGGIHVWELLTCAGDIHMWELLTCGGDIHVWELFTVERHSCVEGTFTCGSYSRVGAIHVWRGIHMWRGHSGVEEAFTCGSYSRVEGTFMCGGDIHVWELFTCGGDIHVWELFTCGEAFMCGGDIHVWRRHSCVGTIHVWRGHSRVEGTFTCGGDIHVWELFTCGGDIHVWELFTCGSYSRVEEAFTCGSYSRVEGHSRVGAIHVWRGHSRVGGIHVWELFTCGTSHQSEILHSLIFITVVGGGE